ncbi:MAG: FAD-dependent monooxygenase [Proteobacteria bacterium]|nr:FAD-dependent monooxygenase [Pseudomonadota bacterium]
MTLRVDVAVLGAGPAGATLARRLAAAGAEVAIVTGRTPAAGLEGYSRRTRALLEAEGLADLVASLEGPVPRTGRWGDRSVRGEEWLAERAQSARVLAAALVGPRLCSVAGPATRIARAAHGFVVEAADRAIAARLVVDARGRRGPQARGPLLLAIGATHAGGGAAATRLAAWRGGWCWIATGPRRSYVQLTVAARRGGGADDWFREAAAEIDGLGALLEAPRLGPRSARPAHARLGRPSPVAGLWRVGDAALALDPLSGQGVYEALRGATVASAALLTVLEGGDAALAARFVADRQHETWRRTVATAAGFYAENAALGPFWRDAAASYAALIEAEPASGPRVERRAVLVDGRIGERAVLVTPRHARGAWQVEGVPLAALWDLWRDADHRPRSLADAAARLDRPLPAVATALRWLETSGALGAYRGAIPSSGV